LRGVVSLRTDIARREGLIAPARLVLSFTLLGLVLRRARLDFQPLWWDEGYSAWFATHPLGQMIRLTAEDIHPPLYYALLHAWTLLAGPGPISLRLVSVAAGVAAIPLMYVAAARILDSRRVGLVAAFLLAINPLQVYYSQEVRMYGLVALLSLGVLWAAWGVFTSESWSLRKTWFLGAAYVVLTTLALYTQYYAIFLPIGLTIFALWYWRKGPRLILCWLGLQAISVVLYLPWVIYAGPRLTLYVSQKVVQDADKPLGLLAYFGRHLSAFTLGHLEGRLAPWWPLALALLAPVVAGLILAVRSGSRSAGFSRQARPLPAKAGATRAAAVYMLATVLLVALFVGWVISLRFPFFPDRGERLLLLALPAFVMLAAAGLDALVWPRQASNGSRPARVAGCTGLALFVVLSAVSLAAFYTVPRYPGDDYRPLIARAVEQGLPGDTVFAVYPWQVGYWRSYAGSVYGPDAILTPSAEWGPAVAGALDDALQRGRVWFPAHLALGAILETQIEQHLSSRAIPFVNEWYGPGTRLSAWAASEASEATGTQGVYGPPIVTYALPGSGELALVAASSPGRLAPAENAVAPVSLSWQSAAAPPELAVSVRVMDDLGQIWAQNDYQPLGATLGSSEPARDGERWQAVDRFGLLIPVGTPPGRYQVELVVLPKDSERPLTGVVPGARATSSARLFEIQVTPSDRELSAERLPVENRQPAELGDGLRFLGYTVDQKPLAPGVLRRVDLFWQATAQPGADYRAFVQLLGKNGAPVAAWEAAPGASYPTSQWTPGTLIRTQAFLRPGAEVEDGRYPLIAGMYRPDNGARLKTPAGKDSVALGSLSIQGRPHRMDAGAVVPDSATSLDATFGGVARLVGFDGLPATPEPPGTAKVRLYWQALGSTQAPYTVFVHLVDEETNAIIAYGDAEPGDGAYPTTGWLKGEYLADPHTISFPPDSAGGRPVRVEIGLYEPATGQRLTLADGSDSLVVWRGQFGR
jgi:4-amino-4-deoxy-L-arabinose transferase-like glycosyltransferase